MRHKNSRKTVAKKRQAGGRRHLPSFRYGQKYVWLFISIIYACMFLRLLKMPETSVFSRFCGLWVKMQKYRILSENGVVNGVVKRSGIERRRQISY